MASPFSMSVEEYLEAERAAPERSEYYQGQVLARPGGSYTHALIAGRMAAVLGGRLQGRPCVLLSCDMKVLTAQGDFFYPDLTLLCQKPQFLDGRTDVLINPTAVVEVLSPSTEAIDRGPKLLSYRGTPSITAVLLVSTDRPVIEIISRGDQDRWWVQTYVGLDTSATLEGLELTLSLAEVFEGVFPASP